MAIVYPISPPTGLNPSSLTISRNDVVAVAPSPFTGQPQTHRWPGQWWVLSANYPVIPDALIDQWEGFLGRLKGRYGTFLFGDPSRATPRGPMSGSPVVDGANQSGDYLNIRGATASVTGWGKAGDYIQIGSGMSATLYRLSADATTDGSGRASLEVWPQIRQSPSAPGDGATVIVSNTVGRFRLTEPAGIALSSAAIGTRVGALTLSAFEDLL